MTRDLRDYLKDILDAAAKSANFVEGMTFEEFTRDDKTVFAVLRALEVIGEAVKNIPDDFRRNIPKFHGKTWPGCGTN